MARAFKGVRGETLDCYDAIVIGAGIGGLISANLLARAGLSVLLIEQHYMVGGYCSTFRRKGYTFDAATHFYPLLGNPSTISGRLLADLGITSGWVKMDPVDHFHLPDGSSFTVPADFDAYLYKLKRQFTEEASALDEFFALVRKVYLLGLLQYFRWRESPRLRPYLDLTVRHVLDRCFRDPKLKLLLAADCSHWGSPPCRTSFVFDSMLRLSYFLGNYYPRGGSQAFADELAQRFEERGGHILMSSSVRRISVQRGAACGVEIETGPARARIPRRVSAGSVISNADLVQTLEQMLGPQHCPPGHIEAVRRLRPTLPCFITHIGVKDLPAEALREAEGYHWQSWDPDQVAYKQYKIFVPTLFEPRMAPPGCHIVIGQRLSPVDFEAVQDWASHKAEVEQQVMADLEGLVPGFSEKVVVKLSASALTSYKYTMNHQGAMLGWEMSPDQLGDGRPGIAGPVRNLYFVGHWTQPGGGITPVIVSAMQAAHTILHRGEPLCVPADLLGDPALRAAGELRV